LKEKKKIKTTVISTICRILVLFDRLIDFWSRPNSIVYGE